jgi:hypothetical protein
LKESVWPRAAALFDEQLKLASVFAASGFRQMLALVSTGLSFAPCRAAGLKAFQHMLYCNLRQHTLDCRADLIKYASEHGFDIHSDEALFVWRLAMQREDVSGPDSPVDLKQSNMSGLAQQF